MRKVLTLLAIAAAAAGVGGARAATVEDPYLWLEEVSSPKAMQWVEAHNAKSTAVLEADPRYQQFYSEALDLAQAEDRIPTGRFRRGDFGRLKGWLNSHVHAPGRRYQPFAFSADDSQFAAWYSKNGEPESIVKENIKTGARRANSRFTSERQLSRRSYSIESSCVAMMKFHGCSFK